MQAVCVRVWVVARTGGRLATNSDAIIAIDPGRHKSVACVSDRRAGAHAFRELDTTPGALDRLHAAHPGAVLVIEACANAGWVHDRAVPPGSAGDGDWSN